MNKDCLLFCSGSGHLLRLEHVDALHQGTDDLRIQFFDLGVLFYLREERIDIEPLRLCFGNRISQDDHPSGEVFLLMLVGGSHLGKALIADFTVEVILVEPLYDAVQFGNALCCLLQFLTAFAKLPVEVTLIFLGEQFHKFRLPFTNKGKHPIYLRQPDLLYLHIAYLVGGAFSFLLAVGGADEMLLFM